MPVCYMYVSLLDLIKVTILNYQNSTVVISTVMSADVTLGLAFFDKNATRMLLSTDERKM